jgi:hypothetical protein
MLRAAVGVSVLCCLLPACGTPAAARDAGETPGEASANASPLADLEWLAGSWAMEGATEHLEERWSRPVGNSMVGSFRWVRDGALWITELLSITQEAGDVIFRLRHFSAVMRPWEAADDAFHYRLTERSPTRVTFTIMEARNGRPDRYIFAALPGDSLLVRLEAAVDGQPSTQEFRFARER